MSLSLALGPRTQGSQLTGPRPLRQRVTELEPLRVTAAEPWTGIQRFGSQLSFRLNVSLWAGSVLNLGQLDQTLFPPGPPPSLPISAPVLSAYHTGHPVNHPRDRELCQLGPFPCVQPKSVFLKLSSLVPPLPPGARWETYNPTHPGSRLPQIGRN